MTALLHGKTTLIHGAPLLEMPSDDVLAPAFDGTAAAGAATA